MCIHIYHIYIYIIKSQKTQTDPTLFVFVTTFQLYFFQQTPRLGQVSNADAHAQMWTCSDYHLGTYRVVQICGFLLGNFWGKEGTPEIMFGIMATWRKYQAPLN